MRRGAVQKTLLLILHPSASGDKLVSSPSWEQFKSSFTHSKDVAVLPKAASAYLVTSGKYNTLERLQTLKFII